MCISFSRGDRNRFDVELACDPRLVAARPLTGPTG
jgi:hypothetical protein